MKPKIDAGFCRRIIALAVITVLILGIFILRLAKFQLINPSSSAQNSSTTTSISTQTQSQ